MWTYPLLRLNLGVYAVGVSRRFHTWFVSALVCLAWSSEPQMAKGELAVALKGAKEVEVERVPLACRYRFVAEGGAPTVNRIQERLAGLVAGRWRFKGEGKL